MSIFAFLPSKLSYFLRFLPDKSKKIPGLSKRIANANANSKSAVLYAYTAPTPIKSQLNGPFFKIGKTVNLQSRQRSYKTLYPSGSVYYSVPCSSIHHAERILHDILKMNGHHIQREIFQIDGELLKSYMNVVAKFTDKMKNVKTSQDVKNILRF